MLRITQLSGEELTCLPLTELNDVKALKQRLHEQHGLPPRFRQRLLHEGNTLDDAVKLETSQLPRTLRLAMLGITQLSGVELTSLPPAELSDVKALKRRLHQQHGLPPRFRQRLLHEGKPLDDAAVIVALSEVSEFQQNELHHAALFGNVAQAEALLQLPMDPDVADKHGATPLTLTAQEDHVDVAQLLLEAGACPDTRDNFGETALMFAATEGSAQVAQLLLEAGAQADSRSDDNVTALMRAAFNGNTSVVRLLLQAGAHVDAVDSAGSTALMEHVKVMVPSFDFWRPGPQRTSGMNGWQLIPKSGDCWRPALHDRSRGCRALKMWIL
ncbi:ANKRD50 [Symbiodinium sp. CCMP2592]|nr:ANKRD50 [Symbiodinium sp. CCMP2592]